MGRQNRALGASTFVSGHHPSRSGGAEGRLVPPVRGSVCLPEHIGRALHILAGEVVAMTFRDPVQRRQRHLGREGGLMAQEIAGGARQRPRVPDSSPSRVARATSPWQTAVPHLPAWTQSGRRASGPGRFPGIASPAHGTSRIGSLRDSGRWRDAGMRRPGGRPEEELLQRSALTPPWVC